MATVYVPCQICRNVYLQKEQRILEKKGSFGNDESGSGNGALMTGAAAFFDETKRSLTPDIIPLNELKKLGPQDTMHNLNSDNFQNIILNLRVIEDNPELTLTCQRPKMTQIMEWLRVAMTVAGVGVDSPRMFGFD